MTVLISKPKVTKEERLKRRRDWRKNNPEKAKASDRKNYLKNRKPIADAKRLKREEQRKLNPSIPSLEYYYKTKHRSKVYFILVDGYCKIGITTNLTHRIRTLRKNSSNHPKLERIRDNKIEVISIFDGARKEEQELHRRFKRERVSGEWFEFSEDIKSFLCHAE